MSKNISFIYDPTSRHLVVEYIGYKGTDFHDGQYFILFELPDDYPNSPPMISVLTESGRFHVKKYLSMSITQYHKESWYPMPLVFLIVAILSAFPDYSMMGIGHVSVRSEESVALIKELAVKSREYNKQHYLDLYESFDKIRRIKELGMDLQNYIDEKLKAI